ncbi:2-C-methyl-D-erythritol 4-phosphate cytidylyltransferase [Chloroflexota bacterium]
MQKDNYSIGAIITGAGYSHRMGSDKILSPLGEKPLLAWSVDICHSYDQIDFIVIVLNESNLDSGRKLISERGWAKVTGVCTGGQRRQDSVFQGLKIMPDCDWIIIHDAARPFLTLELLKNGLEAAQLTGSAVAAVPVKDTIKMTDDDLTVTETLNRRNLWAIQTPQVFRFDIITEAFKRTTDEVTDDASMVENTGYKVKLYMGSYDNIKITTSEDMISASIIAKDRMNL